MFQAVSSFADTPRKGQSPRKKANTKLLMMKLILAQTICFFSPKNVVIVSKVMYDQNWNFGHWKIIVITRNIVMPGNIAISRIVITRIDCIKSTWSCYLPPI